MFTHAPAQSRQDIGTATGQTARQIKDTTDTTLAIEEVIVSTGYQQIPRERATGSFEVVDSSLFHRRIGPNVIDRLENIVPGVVFDRSPGAPDPILVRGCSTIFAEAAPLIVLDNFPYEGDLNSINPNDIESVTMLKDAAGSIWGARGATA